MRRKRSGVADEGEGTAMKTRGWIQAEILFDDVDRLEALHVLVGVVEAIKNSVPTSPGVHLGEVSHALVGPIEKAKAGK